MITVKLLGGTKRSFLSDKLSIDKTSIPVSVLLTFLKNSVSKDMPPFDVKNILVAVNGVDSSALKGSDTLLKDGDVVAIIPVVHGGSGEGTNLKILNYKIGLIRIGKVRSDPIKLLETLRAKFPRLLIQGIRSKYILSVKHAKRVIGVSLAASRSGTLLSNKIETDMLMRFAVSRQINDAINKAGLQKGNDSILIVIGHKSLIDKLVTEINDMVKPIVPFPNNANFIKKEFRISKKELDCVLSAEPLEDLLVERSSVLLH